MWILFLRCSNYNTNFCFQSYPILGHWYFLRVADEVGLAEKCRGFDNSQNPTDAFLTLYSEKEGTTVRALVDALRKCELTHFASQIEMKFAADMDESMV